MMIEFDEKILNINEKKFDFEFPIKKVIQFNDIYLILLDPDSNMRKFGQFPNLLGLDYNKGIIWRAELPTTVTGDCYYTLDTVNNEIKAYSWCS
ncbi:MAG: hypothetical protein ACRYGR_04200 [Janthinobacterium lividum]